MPLCLCFARESNLNFASSLKFKKSFTLIELSIVLLILSLLVGSLLVGRQIVDRAKIQRTIFEFDYYEKAFHQFYDTYRVVPGNIQYKQAIKYAEFVDYENNTPGGLFRATNGAGCAVYGTPVGNKIVASRYYGANTFNMLHMRIVGLIENNLTAYERQYSKVQYQNLLIPSNTYCGNDYQKIRYPEVSWDSNIRVNFYGYTKENQSFSCMSNVSTMRNELFVSESVKNAVLNHNSISIFHMNDNFVRKGKSATFSAKMMSELDAKIDDGRPGTGKLIGLKGQHAYQEGTAGTEDENPDTTESVCYDKRVAQAGTAIYHTSTDLKYGCEVLRVMEDVK